MKFGGTSVGDAAALRNVGDIILDRKHGPALVVVSACAGVTNVLISLATLAADGRRRDSLLHLENLRLRHFALADSLLTVTRPEVASLLQSDFDHLLTFVERLFVLKESAPRLLDHCAAYGERWSSLLLAGILRERRDHIQWADARTVMITDDAFTQATPLISVIAERASALWLPSLRNKGSDGYEPIIVTQGFIGSTSEGLTTTIGRGGSDYSAAIFGSVLGAGEIQIWTDVDGVLTADPTLLAEARRIKGMTFQEASELAYFGAQVLHPSTILPAVEKGIPVRVLNSRRPKGEGTLIGRQSPESPDNPNSPDSPDSDDCVVKSIAYKEGITVINVHSTRMLMNYGFLARVFDVFAKQKKSIDVVTTSEVGVSITVDSPSGVGQILEELREFSEASSESGKAVVCVVGEKMRWTKGIAARVFSALDDADINAEMISHGGSDINLTFVIDEEDILGAVRAIHSQFFGPNASPRVFDFERGSAKKVKQATGLREVSRNELR